MKFEQRIDNCINRGNFMIKNILFLMIIFMTQITFAKVIELDNHNVVHCYDQLKNFDDWDRNVLMLYVKDSPGTDKFRAIYEQVSSAYPKRHLFALNVFDPKADAKENQMIWQTVRGCLTDMWYRSEKFMGKINSKTPAILLDDYAVASVAIDNPVHHKLATKKDIIEFIGEKY